MKKLALCMTMLLLLFSMAGCKKEAKVLTAENVTTNTILAKADGVLQVATVEDFDKTYYNLEELKSYITKEISNYNTKAGDNKVVMDDIRLKGGKAIMILTYTGMDQYCAFNQVTAAYFNGGVGEISLDLPSTLVTEKDGSLASTREVIQNNKYKVLIMYEPYHIQVDGKIVYYSENAKLVDKNELQGADEGMTIVVFKP